MFARSYANLYYLVYDNFGIKLEILKMLQSFGFFMAMAFLAAAFFLYRDLKRKEKLGLIKSYFKEVEVGAPASPFELATNALLGFLIGFKVFYLFGNMSEVTPNPQEWLISSRGSWIGGIVMAALLAGQRWYEKNKVKLDQPKKVMMELKPHQQIGDIVMMAALGGILGAKLFYLFESPENFDQFMQDPFGSFFGGLTIYGGLICGAVVVLYFAYRRGMDVIQLADSASPTLLLAGGIGRLGCHVSGDGDWGDPNPALKPDWLSWMPDRWWAFDYAHNVNRVGDQIAGCLEDYCTVLPVPVYPTPIYEFAMLTLLFTILWSLRKRIPIPGVIFSMYLIVNGLERFTIEQIRVNTKLDFLGLPLTQAEFIAICFGIAGVVGLVVFTRRYKKALAAK
ncbi:hypothetical protein BH09BAC1_BH09BAC1_12300 [soil metagenome]